jgi:hypothetical protein
VPCIEDPALEVALPIDVLPVSSFTKPCGTRAPEARRSFASGHLRRRRPAAAPVCGRARSAVRHDSTNTAEKLSRFEDVSAIVRFNPTGIIDVRDLSRYRADTVYPWVGGTTYHFRLTVNMMAVINEYTVEVRPAAGGEYVKIADRYWFRSEVLGVSCGSIAPSSTTTALSPT